MIDATAREDRQGGKGGKGGKGGNDAKALLRRH
jgi:hypothetical protein